MSMSLVPESPPEVIAAMLLDDPKPVLLDVRTPPEFAQGHIDGSINIPLMELPARLAELPEDKGRAIVTICAMAKRSIPATQMLLLQGYTDTRQLAGGMRAWIGARLPTTT